MIRRLLRILLIPLLLLGLAYGVHRWGIFLFQYLNAYPGPNLGTPVLSSSTEAVAQRVVVVVVDGLAEDTSRQMPALEQLRRRGADLPSWVELPAVSYPGYTALGTGVTPEFSGVLTNDAAGPVRVDSLFARARQAGYETAIVGMSGWDLLYRPWVDLFVMIPWPDSGYDRQAAAATTVVIGQEALRVIGRGRTDLLYVHFGETDDVGHVYGGASPEYLQAALHVDAQIAALAEALDWSRDTLIVTADHGMTARGGHGGEEPASRRIPLVMVGRGITPGRYAEGAQADLVPTVAALLGLPIPRHSQGHTRLDLLVLPSEQRARAALSLGEQQGALYSAYLGGLGQQLELEGLAQARAAFEAGAYASVEERTAEFLERMDAAVVRGTANRLWRDRAVRLPYLILPLVGGILWVAFYRPRRELARPALLLLLFFALFWTLYGLVRGYSLSLSTVVHTTQQGFFLARGGDALIAMGVVAVVGGILWRGRPWEEVLWGANLSALFLTWGLIVQLGLFCWLYGPLPTWRLPQMSWGFHYYLNLLVTVAVGYGAIPFAGLTVGASYLCPLADRARVWWQRRREARRT